MRERVTERTDEKKPGCLSGAEAGLKNAANRAENSVFFTSYAVRQTPAPLMPVKPQGAPSATGRTMNLRV